MIKEQEQRHIYYDRDLQIEAYQLSGIVQKFPNHFHEYYVLGFIEGGARHLWCKDGEFSVKEGDLILFNPYDPHCCAPIEGEILDYRAVNVKAEIMRNMVLEITGREYLPRFTKNMIPKSEVASLIGDLYDAILEQRPKLEKEEKFFLLIEQVLAEYAKPLEKKGPPKPDEQICRLCTYIEEHFTEGISLDQLASMTSFGKSYLLRAFTKQMGVSPYRYLQTIRINKAKQLLEEGIVPAEAAIMAGFSDQSHFTNFFKEFIGLTPKQYQRIFTEDMEDRKGILDQKQDRGKKDERE